MSSRIFDIYSIRRRRLKNPDCKIAAGVYRGLGNIFPNKQLWYISIYRSIACHYSFPL